MSAATTTAKIVRNSFWYGLETVLELIAFVASSVAVARALGPEKLGVYTSLSYPILLLNGLASFGLPVATRRYMAEFLAEGRHGLARSVYQFTFALQAVFGVAVSATLALGILIWTPSSKHLMGLLLAASVLPGVLSCIPAQANMALEDTSQNAKTAIAYVISYCAAIACSLHFHWDLPGLAAAMLIGRTVEASLRIGPAHRRINQFPDEPLPKPLRTQIRRFCFQAIGIQLLTSIVWNRSELIFLAALSSATQVAYYGVSSGMADKLLIGATVFATATGVSLMIESVRDARRVNSIVANSCRFLSFIAIPVNLGAAAIAAPLMTTAYGPKYLSAIPVVTIAAILAIPRAFQALPETLLRAADRQSALLRALILTGVINVALDVPLILRYGAIGAAIGNGIAQAIGVLLLWRAARREFHFEWPFASMARFLAAGIVMACGAFFVARPFPPAIGIFAAVAVAVPLYIAAVRVFRAFDPGDLTRLTQLATRLPRQIRPLAMVGFEFAAGGDDRTAAATPALSQERR